MNFVKRLRTVAIRFSLAAMATSTSFAKEPNVDFSKGDGRVAVVIDGMPVAVYSYKDEKITRPFFTHVRALSGVQVTRHHPPVEGQDIMDHDTFHPGIWMSFGDISGSDYWRIKARVRHDKFVDEPRGGAGRGEFTVLNSYLNQQDPTKVVCNERARYAFAVRPGGYLLLWDSTFSSDKEFYFGDQEEMGIGFRVATPLRVGASGKEKVPAGDGRILDSEGRKNEKQIWGNSAKWCDYSGTMAGKYVGMTLLTNPGNFRPSWFHARDYGLLEANQFGLQAFHKGEASKVMVKPGEKFRIRYGVYVHSGKPETSPDFAEAYEDYVRLAGS